MRRSVVAVKIAFKGKTPGPVLLNKVYDLGKQLVRHIRNAWNLARIGGRR
jgi:hypothetical protein